MGGVLRTADAVRRCENRSTPHSRRSRKGVPLMKSTKSRVAALAVAAFSCLVLAGCILPVATSSASGGGGGGGTSSSTGVAGQCGQMTSLTASNVKLTSSGGILSLSGTVKNCSIYLQSYEVRFDEPSRAVPSTSGCLNCGGITATTPCQAAFSLSFNALLYLSSGSSKGWSASTNIAPSGVADPSTCIGTHTVRAQLIDRSFGTVLATAYVSYVVS